MSNCSDKLLKLLGFLSGSFYLSTEPVPQKFFADVCALSLSFTALWMKCGCLVIHHKKEVDDYSNSVFKSSGSHRIRSHLRVRKILAEKTFDLKSVGRCGRIVLTTAQHAISATAVGSLYYEISENFLWNYHLWIIRMSYDQNLTWLNVRDAATYLRKTAKAIYALVHKGELKPYKPHKNLYFTKQQLDQWVLSNARRAR